MNLSLKAKLNALTTATLTLGGILLSGTIYNNSVSNIEKNLSEQLDTIGTSYSTYLDTWIESKATTISSYPDGLTSKEVEVAHIRQVKDSGEFENVFLADSHGNQINANGVILPQGNDDPRLWSWHINAMKSDGVVIEKPTIAAATNSPVVSIAMRTETSEGPKVIGADFALTEVLESINELQLPGDGELFITYDDETVFMDSSMSLMNKPLHHFDKNLDQSLLSESTNKLTNVNFESGEFYMLSTFLENQSMYVVSVVKRDAVMESVYSELYMIGFVLISVIIGYSLVFNVIASRIFAPLVSVTEALKDIAQGGGDLTKEIDVSSSDEAGELAKSFNLFVKGQRELVSDVFNQANELRAQSEQGVVRANEFVSILGVQEQKVTHVATAMEQMTAATVEIASHTVHASTSVDSSTKAVLEGNHKVSDTKNSIEKLASELENSKCSMDKLNEHASKITEVSSAITEISEQTNLLALNAAIEAARAGEQGKGFAVVADEVRGLANRTKESAQEIQATIETLQTATNEAVGMITNSVRLAEKSTEDANDASNSLSLITESMEQITSMTSQIATAAEEQSQVTQEVLVNMKDMKSDTDSLTEKSEAAELQMLTIKSQGESLSTMMATFKLK